MKNTFKMNQFILSLRTKDIIKITNGTDKDGIFVPIEGIVLRVGSSTLNQVSICFSYIKIDATEISPVNVKHEKDYEMLFSSVMAGKVTKASFEGRI